MISCLTSNATASAVSPPPTITNKLVQQFFCRFRPPSFNKIFPPQRRSGTQFDEYHVVNLQLPMPTPPRTSAPLPSSPLRLRRAITLKYRVSLVFHRTIALKYRVFHVFQDRAAPRASAAHAATADCYMLLGPGRSTGDCDSDCDNHVQSLSLHNLAPRCCLLSTACDTWMRSHLQLT